MSEDVGWVTAEAGLKFARYITLSADGGRRFLFYGGDLEPWHVGDDDVREPFTLSISATFQSNHVYEVEGVEVTREPGGPEISGTVLRQVRIKEHFKWAVRRSARLAVSGEAFPTWHPGVDVPADPDERLMRSAQLYVIARAYGDAPLKSVAEYLKVSQSTATRLIKQARERGIVN